MCHPELKGEGVGVWDYRGVEYNLQGDGKSQCLENKSLSCHVEIMGHEEFLENQEQCRFFLIMVSLLSSVPRKLQNHKGEMGVLLFITSPLLPQLG